MDEGNCSNGTATVLEFATVIGICYGIVTEFVTVLLWNLLW